VFIHLSNDNTSCNNYRYIIRMFGKSVSFEIDLFNQRSRPFFNLKTSCKVGVVHIKGQGHFDSRVELKLQVHNARMLRLYSFIYGAD